MTGATTAFACAVNSGWSEGEIIYLCAAWAKGTPINRRLRKMGLTPRVPNG